MKRKYSLVSMFSGCGGMDLGFTGGFHFLGRDYSPHPFEVVWANDLNPFACKTYQENLGHPIKVGSVWDHFDSMPESCDVLIGGFPCQDISINGKRAGVSGERSGLYRAMVQAVERTAPKIFVAENVKGLLYRYNQSSLAQVMQDFADIGYDVTVAPYHAADYGVPQRRERVFIVGVARGLNSTFKGPAPTHGKGTWVTARAAIHDLENAPQQPEWSHFWSLAQRSKDQGGRVLKADGLAHTIRAECHGNNQFHYSQARRISMREAARFQSFPDDFRFLAKLRETERMIGNAVPPVLAWHLAGQVHECLEQIHKSDPAIAAE